MPRRLRIQFEGAIYHVMARGNGRQRIVQEDPDRQRLLDDLRRTVLRCEWELPAFVFMGNHLHLLIKTPRPNLALNMTRSCERWLSRRPKDFCEDLAFLRGPDSRKPLSNRSSRNGRPEMSFEKVERGKTRASDQVRCFLLRCYRNPLLGDYRRGAQSVPEVPQHPVQVGEGFGSRC